MLSEGKRVFLNHDEQRERKRYWFPKNGWEELRKLNLETNDIPLAVLREKLRVARRHAEVGGNENVEDDENSDEDLNERNVEDEGEDEN